MADDAVAAAVREILTAVPTGCTWLLPVHGADGAIVDFRIAATSSGEHDLLRRGPSRVNQHLSDLYPSIVGGPLWQLYLEVLRTGTPATMPDFGYDEKRSGVVAHATFEVSVHRMLGGLLVWWQRIDEDRRRLENVELLGNLGWCEYDLLTGTSQWSPGVYRVFERDPALGPMTRAEQSAALLPDDRGVSETAWQTLDSGSSSDVTVRFRLAGRVKHVRILSDMVTDAAGTPLKINAVVQDVTARENSRSAIEQLSHQLRTREMTALAEHRLAAQLQSLIQPVPTVPLALPGLQVMVSYLPAESVARVGGDWYHAQELADGRTVLALGDVAGHGIGAASGMAHLRFALIGWLSIGIDDPSVLLTHLNRLCLQLRITSTAAIGLYDPSSRTLTWARAGHAAPLLSRAGTTRSLPLPSGLLLGANADATFPVMTPDLNAHDLLLFYTDGLVERRTHTDPPLLTRVSETLAAASTQVNEATLVGLASRLGIASPDDDTCTLTIRVVP